MTHNVSIARDLGIHAAKEAISTMSRITGTAPDERTAIIAMDVAVLVLLGTLKEFIELEGEVIVSE